MGSEFRDLDMTPRYVPTVMRCIDGWYPVRDYIAYPPNTHPEGCPIKSEYTALACRTEGGVRWFGVVRAYINSELRMVVEGINSRDEVRMSWPICRRL